MDNSQEEEPEAAEKLSPILLSPVMTNSTFSRKCVSIRVTAYISITREVNYIIIIGKFRCHCNNFEQVLSVDLHGFCKILFSVFQIQKL